MHKLLYLIVLAALMILFFSTEAINVDFDSVGPNDSLQQLDFSQADPVLDGAAPTGRSIADSLALLTGGLIMLISASFLRRLTG